MKTEYRGVDWLLDCEPRLVQLEANARSYTGISYRRHKDDKPNPTRIYPGKMRGYALFMEMRLGKTYALLNEYMLFKRDRDIRKLLIFSPNKYKYAWREEAIRTGVDEEVHVYESTARHLAEKFIQKGGQILVVNYEALQYDTNIKVLENFVRGQDYMVAADESVLIKNRNTLAFKAGLRFAQNASVIRILTGKPVVQGPHDLWSQLRFIQQLDGLNFFAFRNTFCKMGGFMGKQILGVREDNAARLQQILFDCAFVAQRAQWGTNFQPDFETRSVEIKPIQAKHYKEMEQEFITFLNSDTPVTADQVITKHIKLQQISSGFLIDENKIIHDLMPPTELPKLNELKNALETEISHKVLVVCFYVHSMELLLEHLAEYNPALIAGSLMMKRLGRDVENEKRRFNSDPKCRVLIGQIQAVKYGHNLMGSKDDPCNTTIYYENTYSLDDRSQSEQRNQGEGQQSGIHIIDYATTRVEKSIARALQRKDAVANAIIKAYD